MSLIPRATLLAPVGQDRVYTSYLINLAIEEVTHVTTPQSLIEQISGSQSAITFISQSYLESADSWDEIYSSVYEARYRYAPIFALLESDCQPILLARAFDYGFNEVIRINQPYHEANARIRTACRVSEDAHSLAEAQSVDAETDFYLDSVLDNHLIAARGYAKRHHKCVYGIVIKIKLSDEFPQGSPPREVHREIIRLASTMKTIARPYDPIFRLDVNRFMVLTFDMESSHIVGTAHRITNMLSAQSNLAAIGAMISSEIYHFPTESDLGIDALKPIPMI